MAKKDVCRNQEKFLRTFEDWSPSYAEPVESDVGARGASWEDAREGNAYLRVGLRKLPFSGNGPDDVKWRVCVWGLDDRGMERDFVEYEDAATWYGLLSEPVIREELEAYGFVDA
jgi:hypothetical protein